MVRITKSSNSFKLWKDGLELTAELAELGLFVGGVVMHLKDLCKVIYHRLQV